MRARTLGLLLASALASSAAAEVTPTTPAAIEGRLPTSAADCAGCHPDVAAQWAASAHHLSSFNNPYYRLAVENFRRERGARASRFCAGCHEPVLLAAGEVGGALDEKDAAAQAGLVCLVCHSIHALPNLEGNGSYHARVAPVPYDRAGHRARLRPALLAEPRFCQACHKVGLDPAVTQGRWLRGQDDYDAWQASAISGNGAAAIYRPAASQTCQDCHMPLVPAVLGDAAAHDGKIRSHRFLGGNAALAHLRSDREEEARERKFVAGAVALHLAWVGAREVDVVLRDRRVGHRFPGGTMDSNQAWIEIEALDATGKRLATSGLRADGTLQADAHLLRAQPVDGHSAPIALRDAQHTRGVAFDTSLSPAEPQVVRYRLPPGTERVEARLLYRKLSLAYTRAACSSVLTPAEHQRCLAVPLLEVARATLGRGALPVSDWQQLVDHGLGITAGLGDSAASARPLFERARALAPGRPEPLLGLARLALRLGRTDEAIQMARAAGRLAPTHPAADYLEARACEAAYRYKAARAPAERLVHRLPQDRTALALVSRIRGVLGDATGELRAADRLIAIDPFLDEGWYQRMLALGDLGRRREQAQAEERYLHYRVDDELNLALRKQWVAQHPNAVDEAVPLHVHTLHPVGLDTAHARVSR